MRKYYMKRWRAPQVVITEVMSLHQLCCMQNSTSHSCEYGNIVMRYTCRNKCIYKMRTVFESNNLVFADIV